MKFKKILLVAPLILCATFSTSNQQTINKKRASLPVGEKETLVMNKLHSNFIMYYGSDQINCRLVNNEIRNFSGLADASLTLRFSTGGSGGAFYYRIRAESPYNSPITITANNYTNTLSGGADNKWYLIPSITATIKFDITYPNAAAIFVIEGYYQEDLLNGISNYNKGYNGGYENGYNDGYEKGFDTIYRGYDIFNYKNISPYIEKESGAFEPLESFLTQQEIEKTFRYVELNTDEIIKKLNQDYIDTLSLDYRLIDYPLNAVNLGISYKDNLNHSVIINNTVYQISNQNPTIAFDASNVATLENITIEDIASINTIYNYSSAFVAGYNQGYEEGSDIAYQNGDIDGYYRGIDEVLKNLSTYNLYTSEQYKQASQTYSSVLDFVRSIFDIVTKVLQVEILPNIKLIYLVAIPLVFSLLKFVLGLFK